MNKGVAIGIILIVACLAFSAVMFKKSLVNYVSFSEATKATDTSVQIMGAPVAGTMAYDSMAHALHFEMTDGHGAIMPVVFKGPKPEDLDTAMTKATKITAQGSYDTGRSAFVADNLLVKCPSKYQGTKGGADRSYGAS
jgi:cytochrome c-type biogenesis protein CcmE